MHLLNVDSHVFVQFKRLVAMWATVAQRSIVRQFVSSQGAELGKRFVARRARMGSQSRVDTKVSCQAPFLWKRLGADAARKGATCIQNLVDSLGDLLGQSIHLNPLALADDGIARYVLRDRFVDTGRQLHLLAHVIHTFRWCQLRWVRLFSARTCLRD